MGILAVNRQLIARVEKSGAVVELPPPHRRYEMWQIANQPTVNECPCSHFYDPESEGPWRHKNTDHHHPICQYSRTSQQVFIRANQIANERASQGLSLQARPDEWDRLRREAESR